MQRRGSRQSTGAKPSTAVGKARSGDGSNVRALQRSWSTRTEALMAAADGEGSADGRDPRRTSASSNDAVLDIGQQAAALGLYA